MRGRRAAGDALAVPDPHRSARAVGIRAGRCGLRSRSALVPRSRQPPGVLVGSRGHRIADTGAASLEVRARALSARPTARDVPRVCAQFVHRGAAAESPHGPSRRPPPTAPRPAPGRGPRRGRHRPRTLAQVRGEVPVAELPRAHLALSAKRFGAPPSELAALTAPELQQLLSCELAAHHRRASGRQLTRASALDAGGQAGPHALVKIE